MGGRGMWGGGGAIFVLITKEAKPYREWFRFLWFQRERWWGRGGGRGGRVGDSGGEGVWGMLCIR